MHQKCEFKTKNAYAYCVCEKKIVTLYAQKLRPFPRGGFPRFNGDNLVYLCNRNCVKQKKQY